jgi:hypothetical protein
MSCTHFLSLAMYGCIFMYVTSTILQSDACDMIPSIPCGARVYASYCQTCTVSSRSAIKFPYHVSSRADPRFVSQYSSSNSSNAGTFCQCLGNIQRLTVTSVITISGMINDSALCCEGLDVATFVHGMKDSTVLCKNSRLGFTAL